MDRMVGSYDRDQLELRRNEPNATVRFPNSFAGVTSWRREARSEAVPPLVVVNRQDQELQFLLDLPLELVKDDLGSLLSVLAGGQPLIVSVAHQHGAEAELVRPFGDCLGCCH